MFQLYQFFGPIWLHFKYINFTTELFLRFKTTNLFSLTLQQGIRSFEDSKEQSPCVSLSVLFNINYYLARQIL